MNRLKESLIVFMALLFAITGCATYKRTPVQVGTLDTYKSKMSTKGITVAADPIDNEIEAKESFYVDVTKANFFPILLIAQNDTSDRIIFMKESVELTDPKGNYYRPVSSAVMADALEHNKMVYALLGFGIFSYMSAEEANRKMASDWRDKELQDTFIMNPGRKRHGFLYFELPEGETPSGYKLTFVVESLESKEKFPFEIVLPTTTFGSGLATEGTQEIAIKINPEEPWTGVWVVTGNYLISGRWRMKQTGRIVKSTKEDTHEIKGKVSGNKLKGRGRIAEGNSVFSFVINLSSDGLSFEGTADTITRSGLIKGKRE
jgi:hypothetical protein